MARLRRPGAERSSQGELQELLKHAQQRLPGVLEMLQVYGRYEDVSARLAAYLEPTRPQQRITTSNQSAPGS